MRIESLVRATALSPAPPNRDAGRKTGIYSAPSPTIMRGSCG
jgi:hypothetical protein